MELPDESFRIFLEDSRQILSSPDAIPRSTFKAKQIDPQEDLRVATLREHFTESGRLYLLSFVTAVWECSGKLG